MRQSEILKLQWSDVDLQTGFVRLKASMTKTDEARSVRLLPEVTAMLRETPRALHTPPSLFICYEQAHPLLDNVCSEDLEAIT